MGGAKDAVVQMLLYSVVNIVLNFANSIFSGDFWRKSAKSYVIYSMIYCVNKAGGSFERVFVIIHHISFISIRKIP